MSDRATLLQQRVLAWSNGLMAVRTLDQLAVGLALPPAADGESLAGALLLLDPRHELRRLAAGEGEGGGPHGRLLSEVRTPCTNPARRRLVPRC